jgi:hypothetical protein
LQAQWLLSIEPLKVSGLHDVRAAAVTGLLDSWLTIRIGRSSAVQARRMSGRSFLFGDDHL